MMCWQPGTRCAMAGMAEWLSLVQGTPILLGRSPCTPRGSLGPLSHDHAGRPVDAPVDAGMPVVAAVLRQSKEGGAFNGTASFAAADRLLAADR